MGGVLHGTFTCGRALALILAGSFAAAAQAGPDGGGGNGGGGNGGGNGGGGPGGGNGLPDEVLELTGVVRDFRKDHVDFDVMPPEGYGQYMWNIATLLGADQKPVYIGGGAKVLSQAHDASGRPISWTLYDPNLGDTDAVRDGDDTGSINSAESFAEWFTDVPGTSLSTFTTVSGGIAVGGEFHGMFEINEQQFYPIDDVLFGNEGAEHNSFFTFEITADFVYDQAAGQTLWLITDDDAWIFVEHQLVADLGGINGSSEQWVDMDRLDLTDGGTYRIRIFKADRSDDSSRFHLVTNIPMTSSLPPTILAMFD